METNKCLLVDSLSLMNAQCLNSPAVWVTAEMVEFKSLVNVEAYVHSNLGDVFIPLYGVTNANIMGISVDKDYQTDFDLPSKLVIHTNDNKTYTVEDFNSYND